MDACNQDLRALCQPRLELYESPACLEIVHSQDQAMVCCNIDQVYIDAGVSETASKTP